MNYTNPFHQLMQQMSEDAGWVLQLVHNIGGARLDQLAPELELAGISQAEKHLQELETLGLVVFDGEIWKTTWTGAGVSNWREQLQSAEDENGQVVTEPREGENGHQLGPECNEFRATLFAPSYCWCCRIRHQHASEVVKAAGKLLRQQRSS
jgi:hypothetical protein